MADFLPYLNLHWQCFLADGWPCIVMRFQTAVPRLVMLAHGAFRT